MVQDQKLDAPQNSFLAKIQEKLDSEPGMFVQPKFLCELGIFGSHSAAVGAIKSGKIPHVRVSPYRVLIEKGAVLSFLKEKYCEKATSA